jgi:uncharacterized Zn-finger protein
MEPPETIETDKTRSACDGGGALGHPRVFLDMGHSGHVDCPYCGRQFVLTGEAAASH